MASNMAALLTHRSFVGLVVALVIYAFMALFGRWWHARETVRHQERIHQASREERQQIRVHEQRERDRVHDRYLILYGAVPAPLLRRRPSAPP